eukprot:7167648-Prorocentrum_lima.AAC.1
MGGTTASACRCVQRMHACWHRQISHWQGTTMRVLPNHLEATVCMRLKGGDPIYDNVNVADLDERFVTAVADLAQVKKWALDKGNPAILQLHRLADEKWIAANKLLQSYRLDLEQLGRAEMEGDTEAEARARRASETKLRTI